jgi:ABC-type sugar transport system substrate-binding protein
MRKTRLSALAVLSISVTTLSGCSSDGGGGGGGSSGDESYTVAQIRWDAGDIFFNGVAAGEEQAIADLEEEFGVNIDVRTVAANDAGEQLNGLQQLITQGIDGVSLVPWRGESMVNVLEQLESEGIPVVVHNLIVPGQTTPLVAFDNVAAGRLAGEAMIAGIEASRGADWASQGGSIMLLRGDITASFDRDRFAGYMEALQPIVDENSGVQIIERADLGYAGEPARGAVADAITSAGAENILAVGSVDGTMAVGGAIPALKTGGAVVGSGQPNAVVITSIDCAQAELDSIAAGELTHCSEQPALAEGELVMRLLYDMMSRDSLEPSDGIEQVEGWESSPWSPVEVTTRDDIEGPWYKTQTFAVPGDLPVDSPDHWAVASGAAGD